MINMSRYSELFWTMFFFLIIISGCAASSHTEDELGSGQNDAEVSYSRERVRRMVSFITAARIAGDKITEQILKGAKRMSSTVKHRNEYVKDGGFHRAVKDFEEAKPQNIHYFQEADTTFGQVGTVGDRTIILKDTVPGEARRSTLTIVKSEQVNNPEAVYDVITYYW